MLEEARTIAQRACDDGRWAKHFDYVREELKQCWERLPQGLVTERTKQQIVQLGETRDPHGFWHGAEVLGDALPSPDSAVLDALRRMDLRREKADALALLGILGATYLRAGWRPEELNALDNTSLDGSPPHDVIQALERMATPVPRSFHCVVFCMGEEGVIQTLTRDLAASRAKKAWMPPDDEVPKGHFPLAWTITAGHPGAAAREAAANTHRAFSVLAAYSTANKVSVFPCVFVWSHPLGNWVDLSGRPDMFLQERTNDVALTRAFLAADGKPDERLTNALESFRVAIGLDDPRVRFVGLWTTLEGLAVLRPGKSVLERVTSVVVPVVASRVLEREITYLAISLRYLGIGGRLPTALPTSKYHHVAPQDVLRAVAGPAKNPAILELFRATAEQPLLCNRLFRVWEVMSDAVRLGGRLKHSETTLEWHVARLYRARNMVVHSGVLHPGLEDLGRHLQFYVQTLLGRVLHERILHPRRSLEAILTGVAAAQLSLRHWLQQDRTNVLIGDVLTSARGSVSTSPLYNGGTFPGAAGR